MIHHLFHYVISWSKICVWDLSSEYTIGTKNDVMEKYYEALPNDSNTARHVWAEMQDEVDWWQLKCS